MIRRHPARLAALLTVAIGLSLAPTTSTAVRPTSASTDGVTARGLLPMAIGADFEAGNIISDTVFFDPGAMTVDQVQAFLNTKGANCVAGEQPCIKDVRVTTVAKAADGLCNGYVGGRTESAAQIIAGVAQSCGVNPRVLIVLLEKEQSLITRTRPTNYAYERATGFGCPDSAPCNAEYFGLFNQLYLAARQYQNYAANPDRYPRYRPGRITAILFSPNAGCGTSDVYLENQATAGLYTYTPYQPNAAALANLYGTGDSCSAYGNRNFWRLFTDWFGSTQGGTLVRTANDATVYLVSGTLKYPIASSAILAAYAPLGPVTYVSQAFLDRRTLAPNAGRFAHGPDGSVYYVDAGTRYYVGTCTLVSDFGGSCGSLVELSDVQVTALTAGGTLAHVVRTTSGRTYYVAGAVRREVADTASLTANGLPTGSVQMADSGVIWLPVGDPVVRSGIIVTNRASGASAVVSSTGVNPVPAALLTGTALGSLPRTNLDNSSVARLTMGATLSPFVHTTAGTYLLRGTSASELADASLAPASTPGVGTEVLAAFTATGAVHAPLFVQPVGDALRYEIRAGVRHPVRDDTELAVLGGTPAAVLPITAEAAGLIAVGRDAALTQFDDVRLTQPFAGDILWLAAEGITTGYPDATFRPSASVNRDAMAAFLYRASGSPAFTAPATPTFTDVPTTHPFYREVEWLASTGVTTGTAHADGTVTYAPSSAVSRGAMAAFLYRLTGSPAFTAPSTPSFVDVGTGSPFYREIEWLASTGVTTGTARPDGTVAYAPGQPVSRGAMAAFLHRLDAL